MFGIVKKPVIPVYQSRCTQKVTRNGMISAIADEGLHGMIFAATGGAEEGFVPVKTYYGYAGYVKAEDFFWVGELDVKEWENSDLMVVSGFCVDVMSIPKSQGVCLASLYRGSIIRVLERKLPAAGWARVCLADGQVGYMRSEHLWNKEFSQAGAWSLELPQKVVTEKEFRSQVVDYALTYLGSQYRWGGRSTAGLDCSGYISTCYMLGGILIYRDAQIVEGYPVRRIPEGEVRIGDLLYFPGHIALFAGEGKYLHSTGMDGCSGVMMNSLKSGDIGYRSDLADSLYAVGSIF